MSRWRDEGRCREVDPELFFPVGESAPAYKQAQEAKAVCRACPVMEACADWAITNRLEHGVWGGLDETELRNIRRRRTPSRRRNQARCGTRPGYKRHHREGTPVCTACANANRTYMNQRNQTQKEAA